MSKKLKKKFPKLRFSEFSDEWQSYKGADITSKITKGSSPSWQGFQYQKSGVLFVTSENVRDGLLDISEPKFVDKDFLQKQKNSQLLAGDILINIVGASIGRCCIYTINDIALINQAVAVFRVNNNHLNNFIAYCYQQSRIQKIISGTQSESARPNLSLGDLNDLVFILPEIAEQEKIASFFGAVDCRLTQLRRKRELLQTYKRGVMQKIFSQQIRFKQDDGSDFSNWEETKLGEIFDFKNGINADKAKYGRGKKFINVLDIINDAPIYHDSIIGSVEITNQEFENNDVRHGDILFQRSSEIREEAGQSNVYLDRDKKATFGGFVIRGRPKISFNPVYFHNLLKTDAVRKEITDRSGGSTRFNVGQDSLRGVPIVMCSSIEEQAKIADFLTTIDRKIEALSRQIDQTEQFKKGLLQKMFV